jgi:hypothetical protein
MDDTIVFGSAHFGAHLVNITEVLRLLQAAGMQVNLKKSFGFTHCHLPWFSNYKGWHQTSARQGSRYAEHAETENAERHLLLNWHGKFLLQHVS